MRHVGIHDCENMKGIDSMHGTNAKSLSNRLYINQDTHMIVGKAAYMDKEEYYTVIAVRKNIGQPY